MGRKIDENIGILETIIMDRSELKLNYCIQIELFASLFTTLTSNNFSASYSQVISTLWYDRLLFILSYATC